MTQQPEAYYCVRDQRAFSVTLGIPDFRVFPDGASKSDPREERVVRLAEEYPRRTFAELVEFYYRISPEIRPDLAESQIRHLLSGPVRAEIALRDIQRQSQISPQDSFLEIGCGSGGFLVAASRAFDQVIGLDIALWWLLLAKKRLEEEGRPATLICAFAECLPFPNDSFQLVVGSDVIEHTPKQVELMREAHRVLASDGALFLATPNRWSLAPEPHVKVWGVGFLPKAWRAPYVRLVRKIPYENIITLNYFDVCAL
ncbi:MAG: class I SAM-dependent methyltransferase, partial [Chloroflexota bacterium]|nr:class I SAM-dependent methyltransferase [Chloroflexota bacterium]